LRSIGRNLSFKTVSGSTLSTLKEYFFEKGRINLSVSFVFSGDGTVTALIEGEIDHHSAALVRSAIDEQIIKKRPKNLKLDFSGVGFMDSSGIGLVMGRYRIMKEHGGTVAVVNTPESINRVMRLAGLERLNVL